LTPPVIKENHHEANNHINKETLSSIIESAQISLGKNDFLKAKALFETANSIDPNNDYILQKLALSTYKSKHPSHVTALEEAISILSKLNLQTTTDPETLGLAGAIYKRLYEELRNIEMLNKSIFYYEKGFYIKNDYYNGINLAFLLNMRGNVQEDTNNAITDYTLANRVREKVIEICEAIFSSKDFKDRSDQYWVVATLEEAYYGLENTEKYNEFQKISRSFSKENWERETTEIQIAKIEELLASSPLT